jgi:hypothetical protein
MYPYTCQRTPRDSSENMLLDVLADSRQVKLYGDARSFEDGRTADAGELEDVRAL